MSTANWITIDHAIGSYTCRWCNRHFVHEMALRQHCRKAVVHRGGWCKGCSRLYSSGKALASHNGTSSEHLCVLCGDGKPLCYDLEDHCADVHGYCIECQASFPDYESHRQLAHHRCTHCVREFRSNNEVEMHEQVHYPKNKNCYGCRRKFGADSAIVIHLESGGCKSNIKGDQVLALARQRSAKLGISNVLTCPGCPRRYQSLKALFQHVETSSCAATYSVIIGQLRHHLRCQIGKYKRRPYEEPESDSDASSADGDGVLIYRPWDSIGIGREYPRADDRKVVGVVHDTFIYE